MTHLHHLYNFRKIDEKRNALGDRSLMNEVCLDSRAERGP